MTNKVNADKLCNLIFSQLPLDHPYIECLYNLALKRRSKALAEDDQWIKAEIALASKTTSSGHLNKQLILPLLNNLLENFEVPTLPAIYYRIISMLVSDDFAFEEIAEYIQEDVGLSASVLKAANSPLFKQAAHVDKVSNALIVLGIERTLEVVLGASVSNLFPDIDENVLTMRQVWAYNYALGYLARMLGRTLKHKDSELLFVLGLLHSIGRLFLINFFPKEMSTCMQSAVSEKVCLGSMESKLFGYNFAEVSALIFTHWNLPEPFIDTMYNFYTPQMAQDQHLASILYLSHILLRTAGIGFLGGMVLPPLPDEVLELAHIKFRTQLEILELVESRLEFLLSSVFGLPS